MLTNQYAPHVIPVGSKVRVNSPQDQCWYNLITLNKGEVGTIKKVTMYIYIVEFLSYPSQEFYFDHCRGYNNGIELVPLKAKKKAAKKEIASEPN